jgi:hypothetical protein
MRTRGWGLTNQRLDERKETEVYASAMTVLRVVYEPGPIDLGPPLLPGRSDELTAYVASAVAEGRKLFDVLADSFVLDRVDQYVSVIDHLAREPEVRSAIAGQGQADWATAYALAV